MILNFKNLYDIMNVAFDYFHEDDKTSQFTMMTYNKGISLR